MKKTIYFLLLCVAGLMYSCLEDDANKQLTEASSEVQEIIKRKIPFEQTLHYRETKIIIDQMAKSLRDAAFHYKGEEETETFDILTDEVLYMEYEDSHTYTFKVRRSNPEYYIENVVLHYNPETGEYDEFLLQYLVNEQEYLDIVNDNFTSEDLPVIARKFENGTFSGVLGRVTCSTSCRAVSVRCGSGDHGPGDSGCTLPSDQQAYTYVSCTTSCNIDTSYGDGSGSGNSSGSGGGGTNTIPLPMEPCNTGGSGSGSSGQGTGIDNGDGMCVVPWVAILNPLSNPLLNPERQILIDYFEWFETYFDTMGDDADYGKIRTLINNSAFIMGQSDLTIDERQTIVEANIAFAVNEATNTLNHFTDSDPFQRLWNKIREFLTSSNYNRVAMLFRFMHRLYWGATKIVDEDDIEKYNNFVIDPIRNLVAGLGVVNMNLNTMSWQDVLLIWLFELGNHPTIHEGHPTLQFGSGANVINANGLKNHNNGNVSVGGARQTVKNLILNNGLQNGSESYFCHFNVQMLSSFISNPNYMEFTLGSYNTNINWYNNGNGSYPFTFIIKNVTGWESGTRGVNGTYVIDNKPRGQGIHLGGTIAETFVWNELFTP